MFARPSYPWRSLVLVVVGSLTAVPAVSGDDLRTHRVTRRPIAMAVDRGRLLVANRDPGTISIVDLRTRRVLAERRVGERLSDLCAVPEAPGWFVAADQEASRILLLQSEGAWCRIRGQVEVPAEPVRVRVSPQGECTVSCLWAHQLLITRVDTEAGTLRNSRPTDLPFAPREQWLTDDGRVFVADSFRGNLAIIDLASGELTGLARVPGHNIRGLGMDPATGELLVSHQWSQVGAPTTRDNVFWGHVVTNVLRSVESSGPTWQSDFSQVRPTHGSIIPLGRERHGAGDPGAIVGLESGVQIVLLSGVSRAAIRWSASQPVRHVETGTRPTAAVLVPDQQEVWIANTFSDSLTVVDVTQFETIATVDLGAAPVRLHDQQRGEIAFHNARLSLDGWFSCHSCHTDGHTSRILSDTFGDGTSGAPKRVLSLLGSYRTQPWGWTGLVPGLSGQIDKSLATTMHLPDGVAAPDVTAVLQTYLGSLNPPPSLAEARGQADAPEVHRGAVLFEQFGCVKCHSPPMYTSPDVFDVGFTDERNRSLFNPPSLLGVSHRGPYFHDNRARSLQEVVDDYRHQVPDDATDQQINDLIAFLRAL